MLGLGNSISRSSVSESGASALRLVSPLLLDTYSGAVAAYSLRKLSSDYSGKAIQIRRASDNVEVDVSFDSSGAVSLDSAVTNVTEETTGSSTSLVTSATNLGQFVANASYTDADSLGSADSALVQCWYDQSGNSNNATQNTAGSQPQIVSSGAVIVENGKPAVQFSALFSLDMATRLTQVQSNFSVRENITTGASVDFLYGDISTYDYHAGGTNNYLDTLYSSTDVRNGSNFVNGQSQSFTTANTATTSSVLLSMIHLSNTARISQICQDRSRSNRSWNGKIQEILIYESDQSGTPQAGIETNINTFYDIYS